MLKPKHLSSLLLEFPKSPPNSPFVSTQRRLLHEKTLRKVSTIAASTNHDQFMTPSVSPTLPNISQLPRPLSLLPFSTLLRSYALTALSSYPLLLTPSLKILSRIAHSPSARLNPDQNPVLHWVLKKTFYAQFCAGESPKEVRKTIRGLKDMGYKGVILAYGKEIVLNKGEKIETTSAPSIAEDTSAIEKDIKTWKEGTLQTVKMAEKGDFIGLKFSGAGHDAMRQLAVQAPPSEAIEQATTQICDLAQARGVRLLFDAEQDAVQPGIDAWTLRFQQRYNITVPGEAVVYGTYQAYLRSTPKTLAQHLAIAKSDGFTLGVKLVRGAYMASDPRSLFWSTKEETDEAYDGISSALVQRTWNSTLKPAQDGQAMAEVAFVLATHNHRSVKNAMAIRRGQTERGEAKIDMAYGQLMGMADEVSCELVAAAKSKQDRLRNKPDNTGPKAYKYLVWGSVRDCLKYLVRRAEENRDAVIRAKGTRVALRTELRHRIWG